MRRIVFVALFITTFITLQRTDGAQSTSSVEGVVLETGTDRPLSDVKVALAGFKGTITDAQGHFVIDGIPEGRYRLVPELKQYVFFPPIDSRRVRDPGIWVQATGTEPIRNVQLRMAREGSLSGTLLKPNGNPFIGPEGSASIMRYAYNEVGERYLHYAQGVGSGASRVRTNDRGEFRIFGIPPGDYYVQFSGGNLFYYPGVTDETKATTLHIGPGEDVRLPPVTIPALTGPEVRFHFNEAASPGSRAVHIDKGMMWGFGGPSIQKNQVTIPAVAIGRHDFLVASRGGDELYYGRATLDVPSSGIDHTLELRRAPHIKTTVIIEEEAKDKLTPNNRICRLRSDEPTDVWGLCGNGLLTPAHYTLELAELAADTYVVSAEVNKSDILANGFDVRDDTEIVVRLSTPAARVRGKVRDAAGNAIPDAVVSIVPDAPLRKAGPLYRSSISDVNGNFELRGIAPGNYHLFAWSDLEGPGYRNSEFMKKFEDQGKPVQIQKAATVQLDVVAF